MTSTKCKNCGADIRPNMKFCGVCGTPTEHPEAEAKDPAAASTTVSTVSGPVVSAPVAQKAAATEKLKKFILPVTVIVAVIVVAGIVFSLLKPSKYIQSSQIYMYNEEDGIVIIPGGEAEPIISLEGYMGDFSMSLDGKAAAILVDTGEDESFEGYSLYYITDKATFVADGVYNAVIAASGKSIAFAKMQEDRSDTMELYMWSGGKIDMITSDYIQDYGVAISPDGKTVAYTCYDEDEEEYIGCYYNYNGKETILGENIQPLAIVNGAKYVYYVKDISFYVQKGKDNDSRIKLGEDIYAFYFNNDLTSVIYNSPSKSYISRNGGEKESLSGIISYLLLPEGTAERYYNYYTCGISDFADTFYKGIEDSIIHIDDKYETNKVAANIEYAQLAQDGKTVIYQKNDSIYKVNGMKEDAENSVLVEEDVQDFIATSDGKAIYFYNTDDELMYQKGTSKPIQVDEDLSDNGYYTKWAMFDGTKLLYVSDEELFWATGSKGNAVKDVEGENYYISAEENRLIVETFDGDDYQVYVSNDGVNFELLIEDQY